MSRSLPQPRAAVSRLFNTADRPPDELYTNTTAYTDNNCKFISVAPQGSDFPSWLTVRKGLVKAPVLPAWLGVPQKY